jgi:hypothetical protein
MDTPVAAGLDGVTRGDTEDMKGLDYMADASADIEGIDLMRNALKDATPKSLVVVIICSLTDMAHLMRSEEELCCRKIKEVCCRKTQHKWGSHPHPAA